MVTFQSVNNQYVCDYIPIDMDKIYGLSGGRGD